MNYSNNSKEQKEKLLNLAIEEYLNTQEEYRSLTKLGAKYGGAIARKFARYLYENAKIYLDRKYKKYNEFCRIEEESSRRKSSKIGEGCDANTEVSSVITKGTETLQSVVGE